MSLFSRKAYDKLITMTRKKDGVPMLVGAIAIFQLTELNIKTNPPCFQCEHAWARTNDAINYAQ